MIRTVWIAGAAFVLAHLLLLVTLARRKGSLKARPAPRHLELYWVVFTAAVFLALAITGSRTWAKTAVITPQSEVIEVYARQFAWSFRYPGADKKFGITNSKFISDVGGNPMGVDPSDPAGKDDIIVNSLRIPTGRDVILLLHSRDVIHDLFVRELRTKQDIVPGMEIPLEIHVDVPGQYEIACAELCGLGHSQMRALLTAMPAGAYEQWRRTASTAR